MNCALGEMEDEVHFLIKCTKFDNNRKILFDKIASKNAFFHSYTDTQKLIWLLSNEDLEDLKNTAVFIEESFKLRN